MTAAAWTSNWRALKELGFELGLELLDAPAQGRLGNEQAFCGRLEAGLVRHRHKSLQFTEI
jgi:hypothetical protein